MSEIGIALELVAGVAMVAIFLAIASDCLDLVQRYTAGGRH